MVEIDESLNLPVCLVAPRLIESQSGAGLQNSRQKGSTSLPSKAEPTAEVTKLMFSSDLGQTSLREVRANLELRLGLRPGGLGAQRDLIKQLVAADIEKMTVESNPEPGKWPQEVAWSTCGFGAPLDAGWHQDIAASL